VIGDVSSPESGRRPSHKISREDVLVHAYAQCRSNKGAPGVDGQDFAAIEAYGVERWLAELALALRLETYRPEPIRRVFIPKANGKLRPLGISTVRDRVCMTAAMLVLEPIFGAPGKLASSNR
jgi:retron-type reverse transcriptase